MQVYHTFQYQAKFWHQPRRVVAKVEWHQGEFFPRVGFIVTNLNKHSKNVVKFCNGRGTAEQWIKEAKIGTQKLGPQSAIPAGRHHHAGASLIFHDASRISRIE